MSRTHVDQLPGMALQLALLVEQYRHDVATLRGSAGDDEAHARAGEALRRAGPIAFALPALWPAWGEFVVRHSRFALECADAAQPARIEAAARGLDEGAEALVQRCVAWAVKQSPGPAPEIGRRFTEWSRARHREYELSRQVDACAAAGVAADHVRELREQLEAARREADRLCAAADSVLGGTAAANDPHGRALDYEQLLQDWRDAEDAAVGAELAILEMDLKKLPVQAHQRERAGELRRIAHEKRAAVFRAGEI